MEKNRCRICKSIDDEKGVRVIFFSFGFKSIPLCENCADSISLQQITNNYTNKWKTYRELNKKVD